MSKPTLPAPFLPTRRQLLHGVAAASVVGCGPRSVDREPPGLHELEDTVHGKRRRTKLIIPDGLVGPAPMLIGLHDTGEEPSTMFDDFGWRAACAERGWVGAFPLFPLVNENEDNTFLGHLIERASALGGVDRSRVYVVGHGGGGRRAYAIGATRGDLVRAIGASAAVVRFSENDLGAQDPKGPAVSVIHVHGGADTRVPLGGGTVRGGDNKTRPVPPLDDGLKHWVDYIDGAPTPMALSVPEGADAARWVGKGEEVVRVVQPAHDHTWNASLSTALMADFFASLPPRGV